jgi:hypothetical protein
LGHKFAQTSALCQIGRHLRTCRMHCSGTAGFFRLGAWPFGNHAWQYVETIRSHRRGLGGYQYSHQNWLTPHGGEVGRRGCQTSLLPGSRSVVTTKARPRRCMVGFAVGDRHSALLTGHYGLDMTNTPLIHVDDDAAALGLCLSCHHPLSSHDAIGTRWCAVTARGVGPRKCMCSDSVTATRVLTHY